MTSRVPGHPGNKISSDERNGHSIVTEISSSWVGWRCRTCHVWATWTAEVPAALDTMIADAERHAESPPFPHLVDPSEVPGV